MREIIVSERDSYESWRGHKWRKPLTCVIGARGADGCAIVADTKAMREYEASNISKFHILWDRVAIAGAGTSALLDKFAEGIRKSKIPSAPDFDKVVETIEDIIRDVSARYQTRLGPDFGLEALIMGLEDFDKGEPYLRYVYQEGITEDVGQVAVIGHGAPYAHPLHRLLYDPMLTANELAVLGYFVISTIVYLGIDQTVGMTQMGPECVILRANEEPKFLSPLDDEFKTARASLENLKFRANLITSIWQKIPMAYEGMLLEGKLPDIQVEQLKEREWLQKLGIYGYDVWLCGSCSKRIWKIVERFSSGFGTTRALIIGIPWLTPSCVCV